jgi:hypothetical protein
MERKVDSKTTSPIQVVTPRTAVSENDAAKLIDPARLMPETKADPTYEDHCAARMCKGSPGFQAILNSKNKGAAYAGVPKKGL